MADVAPEFIRNIFAQLLVDDGGDIDLRQKHILAFMDSCNAMLEKHFPKKWKYYVLAYDLIYCFDAYKLYDSMKAPPVKTKATGAQQRAYRMEQAARIQVELEGLQDQIDELEAAITVLPKYDFTGEALKTRVFGIVEIQRQEENYLHFEAKGRSMTFVLPGCIANGFLVCDDAELVRRYKNEHEMSERIKELELQQKVKMVELNQY